MSEFLKTDDSENLVNPETDEFFTEKEFLDMRALTKEDLDFSLEETKSLGEKTYSLAQTQKIEKLNRDLEETERHINKMQHLSKSPDHIFKKYIHNAEEEKNFYDKLHYYENKRSKILKQLQKISTKY